MTSARIPNRGLLYHRDSGGEHETTPGEYVKWGARVASKHQVSFKGTPDDIRKLMQTREHRYEDVFLDYCVKGNQLTRKGLDELFHTVRSDQTVSHVFIVRRDRLARPDDPLDGLKLENELRRMGVTLVFQDMVLTPLGRSQRGNISEAIVGLIDYDKAGKDRHVLSQQIISSQIALASAGFATGGRPPYGFERWLARANGERVRKLVDGESVQMAGHHVVWFPVPEEDPRWKNIVRILTTLETEPASRVAAQLTADGIPSPDHGRSRTDRGISHETSGAWHSNSVTNIARNPLLLAVVQHGRRSMGDVSRLTRSGPRELTVADERPDGKPKVVINPAEHRVIGEAHFAPRVDVERQKRLLTELDRRGETQRGKPRSRDPGRNPLGARIFDIGCTWPMYRQPYQGSFRYLCGLYQQSHGVKCKHNHIDGMTATKFLLNCVRQRILDSTRLKKLEAELRSIARKEFCKSPKDDQVSSLKGALAQVQRRKERVGQNMAFAETSEQMVAMQSVFNDIVKQESELTLSLNAAESSQRPVVDIEAEVATAMAGLNRLSEIAQNNQGDLSAIRQLFNSTNAKLFLRFAATKVNKRVLNKVDGGVVTFGNSTLPITPYCGPTGRRALCSEAEKAWPQSKVDSEEPTNTGQEGKSLGNVNRGERI